MGIITIKIVINIFKNNRLFNFLKIRYIIVTLQIKRKTPYL